MKKIGWIFLVALTSIAHAQSISLSNISVLRPAVGKPGQTTYTLSVGSTISTPVDGASVIVWAGSAKDKKDGAIANASFHKVNEAWQLFPLTASYANGHVLIGLPIELTKQSLVKVITLFVVDKNGAEISNRLYYTMEGN